MDSSLARGIARMTLRDIAEAGTITHRPLDGVRLPKGRKGRVLVMDVRLRQLRPLLLHEERDEHLAYGGAVAYAHLSTAAERSITLKSETLYGVRSDGLIVGCVPGPRIKFTAHSVERLHQRKSLWNFDELRAEFLLSALSLLALTWAAGGSDVFNDAPLTQVSFPCLGGALRCVTAERFAMVAKTFIASPSQRERALFSDLAGVYNGAALADVGRQLLWFTYFAKRDQEGALHAAERQRFQSCGARLIEASEVMERLIQRHPWLAEPYEERHDPAEEAWRHHDHELRSGG